MEKATSNRAFTMCLSATYARCEACIAKTQLMMSFVKVQESIPESLCLDLEIKPATMVLQQEDQQSSTIPGWQWWEHQGKIAPKARDLTIQKQSTWSAIKTKCNNNYILLLNKTNPLKRHTMEQPYPLHFESLRTPCNGNDGSHCQQGRTAWRPFNIRRFRSIRAT